jgi:HlyD family secretion protein
MKKVISVSLCAAVLVFSLAACNGTDNRLSVTTAKVKSTNTLTSVDYSGVIHASQSVAVISSVSAKAVSVNVKLGQKVKAGETLMQLDTSDAILGLKQAQAGLDSANANYEKVSTAGSDQAAIQARQALLASQNEQRDASANYVLVKKQFDEKSGIAPAQAAYDKAKSDYNKTKLLFSTGASTQYDLTNAQNTLSSASAQLESATATAQTTMNAADSRQKNALNALKTAQENYDLTVNSLNPVNVKAVKASVDAAEATLEVAQKRISDSAVKSPITGTIGAVNVKIGDLVTPQVPSFQLIGNTGMEVDVNVTESMVRKLVTGTKATVTIAATGEQFASSVTEIAPMANVQSGLYLVKAGISDSGTLKDGMQTTVHFESNDNTGFVLVPAKSVLERDGKSIVFAARNGRAVQVDVTTGQVQGAYINVKGLSNSDEVIVQGAGKAKSGDTLHIVSNTNG